MRIEKIDLYETLPFTLPCATEGQCMHVVRCTLRINVVAYSIHTHTRDKSRPRVTRECKNFRCSGALDTKATTPRRAVDVGSRRNCFEHFTRTTNFSRVPREEEMLRAIALPVVTSINFEICARTSVGGAQWLGSSVTIVSFFCGPVVYFSNLKLAVPQIRPVLLRLSHRGDL